MAFNLFPSNDITLVTPLSTVDPTTQQVTPLTSGTVQAFLATSNLPTATAADASLITTCSYSAQTRKWLIPFNGAVLTPSLLDGLFAANPTACYCIVTANSTDIRAVIELVYVATRPVIQ